MHRAKILFILFLGSFLIISGCATLQKLVKKPEVTYERMSLRDMSLFDCTMVFHLNVSNPNPIGLKLSGLNYRLKVNNKELLSGVLDKGLSIKANGSEPIEIPVTIKYMDFFNSVSEFITQDEVLWDLSGAFQIMGFDIPYHAEGKLPIPKLPKISLKRIDVSKISFTGASLIFLLDVENNNPFTVNLSSLDYRIKVSGQQFASGKTKSTTSIGNNKKSTLSVPVNVSFMELGRSAYNLLKKASSDYEISGSMTFNVPSVGEKRFPFSKKGSVPLKKK